MADLKTRFDAAAAHVKDKFGKDTSNEELLELYKYFKQGTVGDCNTAKPGMLDFTGKAKWTAWDSIKGTSQTDAQQKYIEAVNTIAKAHGYPEFTA